MLGFNHGLPCYVKNMALGPQSRQKPRPTASVFVYLSPSGHVFNIAWQAMIKTYIRLLATYPTDSQQKESLSTLSNEFYGNLIADWSWWYRIEFEINRITPSPHFPNEWGFWGHSKDFKSFKWQTIAQLCLYFCNILTITVVKTTFFSFNYEQLVLTLNEKSTENDDQTPKSPKTAHTSLYHIWSNSFYAFS